MLGLINRPNLVAIDTGCLWGGELTAVALPGSAASFRKMPLWAKPTPLFRKNTKKDLKAKVKSSKETEAY